MSKKDSKSPLQGNIGMTQIFKAITHALRDLIQIKIVWIMIWPVLVASLLWLMISMIFWDTFSEWITQSFILIGVADWLAKIESEWVLNSIQGLLHLLVFVPLVMVTTLIITAFFVMPALIKFVAKKRFPQLKYKYGGTVIGSVYNALFAIIIYMVIWAVSLPLWAFGLGLLVPFIAAAFLNQQLFRYDALAEHADAKEMKKLLGSNRLPLWHLGLLTGLVQYVPLLNIVAPTFAALAFIHYELARLEKVRASKAQIEPASNGL